MNARLVVCLALVAVTGFGTVRVHGDTSLNASASLDVSLSKGEALAAEAQANPSAPPDESTTLLSAHKMDIGVNITKTKQPLLTVAEAPCKSVCHDKCDYKMEKHCLTVDVPKKDCNMIKKTIAKQHCQKKCKPALAPKADSIPNPSAPPAALTATKPLQVDLSLSKSLNLSVSGHDKHDLSLSSGLSADTHNLTAAAAVSADKHNLLAAEVTGRAEGEKHNGRKLQGILKAGARVVKKVKKGAVSAVSNVVHNVKKITHTVTHAGRKLQAAESHISKVADVHVSTDASLDVKPNMKAEKLHKLALPKADLQCEDVCVDASYVVPELQCTESTQQVEKCTVVPEKVCQKECVCIPQKTITLNKLSKPRLKFDVDKQHS